MIRKNPAIGPATVLTVSLAVCLGVAAAAEAATVSPMVRPADTSERLTLTNRQRHALATLLANLTDAARKFQQAPQFAAAPVSLHMARPAPADSPALRRPLDRPHSLPTPPLRPALRNLPPPATR